MTPTEPAAATATETTPDEPTETEKPPPDKTKKSETNTAKSTTRSKTETKTETKTEPTPPEPEPEPPRSPPTTPGVLKSGKPWRGVPVPAGVSLTSSSPAAVVFETEHSAEALMNFYEHHLGRYGPTRFAGGMQFSDEESPLSRVSISVSPIGRMLVLSPNAQVMEVQRATTGDSIFGLPLYPGCTETARTTISAIYNTKDPVEQVMAWYRNRVPHQPGLMILDNVHADEPSLIINNQNAVGLTWEMLNVTQDTTTATPTTRIIVTKNRE